MLFRTFCLLIALFLAIAPVAQALGQCAMMGAAKEAVHSSMTGHDSPQLCVDEGKPDKAPAEKGCYGDALCFPHLHAISIDLANAKSFFETGLLPNTPYRISLISQTSPPEIKPPIDIL